MRIVAMRTAIILKSMLPPMEREISSAARARSGGPRLGNFEGAAIDRSDVEDFAGLARGVARDLRVPERVAVHRDEARDRDDRRGHRLPDERAARVAHARADQGRDA